MIIEVFKNGVWNNKEIEDFDDFYADIVLEEIPFKFNCTEEEKEKFLEFIDRKSAGLDDCDYYRFNCDYDGSVDEIYIFDDLVLCTLDRTIKYYERVAENFRKIKEQIEKT